MSAVVDLREAAALAPMTLDGLDDLTMEERAAALTNWRMRMVSEHVSARVFASLVEQMMRAGLRSTLVKQVGAMVEQELDHGERCARVVAAMGGEPVAARGELPWVPRHDDVPAIEGVLRNVISIGCCSETVAVALVGTERELAATQDLRATLDRILADEVGHARFGWSLLAELAPSLDRAARWRLSDYLVACFVHQIDFHAPFLGMGEASERALGMGAPDGETNWAIFLDTMEGVTVPGLERQGLHAQAAWQEAVGTVARRAVAGDDARPLPMSVVA